MDVEANLGLKKRHRRTDKKAHIDMTPILTHGGINFAVGLLCYVLLYTNRLVNQYDGIWASSVYETTAWEISLGRWLWPVMNILRDDFAGDPLNSILSIAIIALGNAYVFDLFNSLNNRRTHLYSSLIMASATVCVFLSYRFMSPVFAVSYLLSVLCVYALNRCKQPILGLALSIASLVCSLALYQSNIGCTCLLIVALGMVKCVQDDRTQHSTVKYLFRNGLSVVLGIVIYTLIWRAVMAVKGIEAVDYKGAGSASLVHIITNLPGSIVHAYDEFFRFFFTTDLRHSMFQATPLYIVLWASLVLWLLLTIVLLIRKDIRRALWLAAYILVIPIACNLFLLLAPGNLLEMQMTSSLALLIPVILILADQSIFVCFEKRYAVRYASVLIVIASLFLYGNVHQVAYDQNVMYEGTKATETLLRSAADTAIHNELYDENQKCVFIGVPSENPLYKKSSLWHSANQYARFGQWWEGVNGQRSYQGMLRRIGIHWPVLPFDEYDEFVLRNDETIRSMPLYPYAGSMQLIEDVLVIRISNSPYIWGLDKPVDNDQTPVISVWYEPGFVDKVSKLHVTTREEINYLTITAGNTELGSWQASDVEMIHYSHQKSKEWIIDLTFEEPGIYDLCYNVSFDGMRYVSHREGHGNALEIKNPPIFGVQYDLNYENAPSLIRVTTRNDIEYLTLNLGDAELSSWQADQANIVASKDQDRKEWLLEYTFEFAGSYDLWFRASVDGITYFPYSPGIENAAEIEQPPIIEACYLPAEEGEEAAFHVTTRNDVGYLKLYFEDAELAVWHISDANVTDSDQQGKEWVIPYDLEVGSSDLWFAASIDGIAYEEFKAYVVSDALGEQ